MPIRIGGSHASRTRRNHRADPVHPVRDAVRARARVLHHTLGPLLVDRRIGSKELQRPLSESGIRTRLTTLDFGDVAWRGSGPHGACWVGVERKKVSELLQCQRDARFAGHQLPGMLNTYQFPWLLIEGVMKCGAHGELQVFGPGAKFVTLRHSYYEVMQFLLTLQQKAGIQVVRTAGYQETCHWIATCYQWWQKEWAKHKSAYRIDAVKPDSAVLESQSLVRKIAAQLPGVYWVRSKAVEGHFASVEEMVNASEQEWQRIDGIGKGIAATVTQAIREKRKKEKSRG